MTTATASLPPGICTPYLCPSSHSPSSFTKRKPILYPLSTPVISGLQASIFGFSNQFPQLGLSPFLHWNGLRQLGISISSHFVKRERKGKCTGKGVYASLFGVGAPEALVIGVVALLVFGPKGLAEVARTLGKSLRQFQPTIRELQEVSREFKSTLEREIGLDELRSSTQNPYRTNITNSPSSTQNTSSSNITDSPSNPSSTASSEDSQIEVDRNDLSPPTREYSSEEYLKITEEQLKASAALQDRQTSSTGENQTGDHAPSEDPVKKTTAVIPPPPKPESDA